MSNTLLEALEVKHLTHEQCLAVLGKALYWLYGELKWNNVEYRAKMDEFFVWFEAWLSGEDHSEKSAAAAKRIAIAARHIANAVERLGFTDEFHEMLLRMINEVISKLLPGQGE